jgi:hypothetical protein
MRNPGPEIRYSKRLCSWRYTFQVGPFKWVWVLSPSRCAPELNHTAYVPAPFAFGALPFALGALPLPLPEPLPAPASGSSRSSIASSSASAALALVSASARGQRRRRERRCGRALGAPRCSLAGRLGRLLGAHRRSHVLQALCSFKCIGMGVAEHAPVRFQRGLEHLLRLGKPVLPCEGRCQIARTRERVGMLLSQHPPPRA